MNISGISGVGAAPQASGEKVNHADGSALQAKLDKAKNDLKGLQKKLNQGGGNSDKIKADIKKKEQEIQNLEKQIQNSKSKPQQSGDSAGQIQNTKAIGKDGKVVAQQAQSSGNTSATQKYAKPAGSQSFDVYA